MTAATPLDPSTTDVPTAGTARLRRSDTDRMLAGVSGGLADYTGIDVVLWRVSFVALTLLGGSGLLFYALLWVLMPLAPEAVPGPVDRLAGRLNDAAQQALGPRGRRS